MVKELQEIEAGPKNASIALESKGDAEPARLAETISRGGDEEPPGDSD